MDKNMKAFAFLRISSHKQEDNFSHDTQREEIKRYCKETGLVLIECVEIQESAKNADERKQYHAARGRALRLGCGHFVFYMYDRETRNLRDNEENETLVKTGRIILHYAKDRKVIDQDSPDSDFFMRDINAAVNKQYSRIIGTKVKDACRTKARGGWYPNNHLPLGYIHQCTYDENGNELKNGKIIVRDPDPSKVKQVIREFELRAEGLSLAQIRKRIINEGFIPVSKVPQYGRSTIEGRLKNKFYRGFFDWDGVEYSGKHPIIIPEPFLGAVNHSFGLKRFIRRPLQEQGVFSGGWIKCGDSQCGCHVVYDPKVKIIKATGERRKYDYYHCTNGKKVHSSLKGTTIKEENIWKRLEGAVDQITITSKLASDIANALNKTHDKVKDARKKEIENYKIALNALEGRENRLHDLLDKKTIDEEDFKKQLKRIKDERAHFTELLKQAHTNIDDAYLETAESILELAKSAKTLWLSRSPVERRELLDQLLSNPRLEDSTVQYDLKKPFLVLARMTKNQEWLPGTGSNRRPAG